MTDGFRLKNASDNLHAAYQSVLASRQNCAEHQIPIEKVDEIDSQLVFVQDQINDELINANQLLSSCNAIQERQVQLSQDIQAIKSCGIISQIT